MRYAILVAPVAASAFKRLSARRRAEVRDALERFLRHEPTKLSQSRIKSLRGLTQPHYRLRVGDLRVFYDVTEQEVHVLAILTKERAQTWLDQEGTRDEEGRAGEG